MPCQALTTPHSQPPKAPPTSPIGYVEPGSALGHRAASPNLMMSNAQQVPVLPLNPKPAEWEHWLNAWHTFRHPTFERSWAEVTSNRQPWSRRSLNVALRSACSKELAATIWPLWRNGSTPPPEALLDEAIIIHKMWKLGVDNKIVLPGPKNGHNMQRTVHPNTKVYQ